jgi:ABC-type enterobactin transport system permease subunit
VSKVAKALIGGLLSAYALYQVATGTQSSGGEVVVLTEWIGIAVSGICTGLTVWAVPNAPQKPE